MRQNNVFNVPFRRKRQGRTYYRKRISMLMSNKSRFVVRASLRNFQASVIEYNAKGDKVLLMIDSKALVKLGWKGNNGNLPSAYLIGALAGKKALEKGIKDAVLDLGFNKSTKGSRVYAALAGAVDMGLKIPFNPEVLPSKDRISGEHIAKYAHQLQANEMAYKRQFSNYTKKGISPADIVKHFNEIKVKMHG